MKKILLLLLLVSCTPEPRISFDEAEVGKSYWMISGKNYRTYDAVKIAGKNRFAVQLVDGWADTSWVNREEFEGTLGIEPNRKFVEEIK